MRTLCRAVLAANLFGFCSLASAQGSVTLYGIIDTGVDWENHVATAPGQNAAVGSAFRMTSLSASLPSRWGVRGTEDLGGGLTANFELENGFAPNNGTFMNGDRLFGRSAWVGIDGAFGSIKLGRQLNMTYAALLKTTVIGPSLYSVAALDPYLPNARSDNAISYFGNFRHLVAGVTYSFGRDASEIPGAAAVDGGAAYSPSASNCPGNAAGDTLACRQITALLGYWGDRFGAQLVYDEMRGGPGIGSGSVGYDPSGPTLLPVSGDKTTRYLASGYAQIGPVHIAGGAIHRKTTTTSRYETDIFYGGASYLPLPDIKIDAEISRITTTDHKNANYYVMRAAYLLSKRTQVYTMVGFMQNNSRASYSVGAGYFTVAGTKQTGVMLGLMQAF
jgi:predicted porin